MSFLFVPCGFLQFFFADGVKAVEALSEGTIAILSVACAHRLEFEWDWHTLLFVFLEINPAPCYMLLFDPGRSQILRFCVK